MMAVTGVAVTAGGLTTPVAFRGADPDLRSETRQVGLANADGVAGIHLQQQEPAQVCTPRPRRAR